MSSIAKGTWVEVEQVVNAAPRRSGGRALPPPMIPTHTVPQTQRLSGFLLEAAELGQTVRIRTITGQVRVGKLRIQSPSYGHSFGHTVPEQLQIGRSSLVL